MENTTKHALITGGTSGVGLSIVKALVKHNFRVTFIGSNLGKGKAVEADLLTTSKLKQPKLKMEF